MSVDYIEADELVRVVEDWIKGATASEYEILNPSAVPDALAQLLGDHIAMCKDPSEARKEIIELIDAQLAVRQKSGKRLKAFSLGYSL